MPRTKIERMRQIRSWLQDYFPAPGPVRLNFQDLFGSTGREHGRTYRTDSKGEVSFVVVLDPYWSWRSMIDTLIHEWAHVTEWTERKHHSVAWGAQYARIYHKFFDCEGWRESREYPY